MQFHTLTILAAVVVAVIAAPAEVVARQTEDIEVAAPVLEARAVTQGVSVKAIPRNIT
jgi:hypothetical protein